MKSLKSAVTILLIITLAPVSCKPKQPEKDTFVPSFSTYKTDLVNNDTIVEKNEIFYGLLTPVEICAIFNRLGVPYDNATLNPVSNKDLYLSSSKASINTGVYGVDLGYLKIFGTGQEMIDYMATIREMSNKLGIPDELLSEPARKIRKDFSNRDSIMTLTNKAYYDLDNYLRNEGRESSAGLMMMGGWIEALYIATQLVYNPDNPDPEVVQKIAEQKYTLTSLLCFMKNYYDDPVVMYYTKKLKYLKNFFDSFEIYFRKGDLEIDTLKQVLRSSGTEMDITVETLNGIRDYVNKLRTEIVEP